MFFKGSRYERVPAKDYETAEGRVIRYKALRRIPKTPGLTKHVVDEGERLDHISFDAYRDPERFWRIADANLAVDAHELTDDPGRVLDIPEAEGGA